jgi:hypothetical protein
VSPPTGQEQQEVRSTQYRVAELDAPGARRQVQDCSISLPRKVSTCFDSCVF